MESSLPSLEFFKEQIKEWVGILLGKEGAENIEVEFSLPEYNNVAAYCLSAALAFTATIVFVMAWKKSNRGKGSRDRHSENAQSENVQPQWLSDGKDGAGETVPWILQEGPPGEDPIPPVDADYGSSYNSEVDLFEQHLATENSRKHVNKINGQVFRRTPHREESDILSAQQEELPWLLQESVNEESEGSI